ncbi:hypothetical protein T09_902 [Trichinella sp. T9]|nr:hypothetical protein T09_902 [Trichinella sp. T9]
MIRITLERKALNANATPNKNENKLDTSIRTLSGLLPIFQLIYKSAPTVCK